MLPFGKGGSDIIWALAILWFARFRARELFGFLAAISTRRTPSTSGKIGYGRFLVERSQPCNSTLGARLQVGRLLVSLAA